jgi:capsular polysaccharide biosynthesis protein
LIFDNYSGPKGFAHWLCDGLTRIAELNSSMNSYTVLLPEYFKKEPLYLESLSFFNITKIEYLKDDSLTKVPNLYVPSHICGTGNFNPANLKKLRDIILPQIKSGNLLGEFIYISRAKSNRRFVENEDEVIGLLKQYGFMIVYMEEHSFTKQIEIISQAKIVMSIHGAALSLSMFMREQSVLFEFRNKNDDCNNMYYCLASAINVNYYYLLCDSKIISENANSFNLSIDIAELEQELKTFIRLKT